MQKKNLILITILVFALFLVGTYVYALSGNPGHSADYIGSGSFGSQVSGDTGNYIFNNGGNVGIGNLSPSYKLDIAGSVRSSGEIISTSSNAFRMVSGNYGAFFRNDGSDTYFLLTNSGNQYGSWNSLRPFYVNNSSGNFYVGHNIYMGSNKIIDSGGGWHRTYGDTGWYNGTYGGGWYMTDTTWVRAYNSKPVYSPGEIRSGAVMRAPSFYDLDNSNYYVDPNGEAVLVTVRIGPGYLRPYGSTNDLNVRSNRTIFRDWNGNDYAELHVRTIYKTNNYFKIDHPTKPGMKLIHSVIEGPESAVFYRGEAQLESGKAVVRLPDYFETLTRKENRTVLLTCKDGWTPIWISGSVENGEFVVKTTEWGNKSQKFYWEVKAVRADVEPLKVERKASDFENK